MWLYKSNNDKYKPSAYKHKYRNAPETRCKIEKNIKEKKKNKLNKENLKLYRQKYWNRAVNYNTRPKFK